jgi:hypothetical protein
MMDCQEYRRLMLAEPGARSPELAAHRDQCEACREFTVRLTRFEDRLVRAMQLPVTVPSAAGGVRENNVLPLRPRTATGPGAARHDRSRRGRWALAASVLVGVGVAGALWLGVPRSSLAGDVVAHMAGEPDAWRVTDTPASSAKLKAVLDDAHVRLRPDAMLVSYASSCEFHQHQVPHFVVQTAAGPMTVMVLVHDKVLREQKFEEQGFRGVILPVPGHGSMAVLTKSGGVDTAEVERIAARLIAALDWTA